jgi:hypothetical protein
MTDKTDHIRKLNDLARTQPAIVNASWVITPGVRALLAGGSELDGALPEATAERIAALRHAVASFNDFPEGNDPYREHDFGSFELYGDRLFWKVDYYHPDRDTLAPEPANIELCRRVVTIMLAEEY